MSPKDPKTTPEALTLSVVCRRRRGGVSSPSCSCPPRVVEIHVGLYQRPRGVQCPVVVGEVSSKAITRSRCCMWSSLEFKTCPRVSWQTDWLLPLFIAASTSNSTASCVYRTFLPPPCSHRQTCSHIISSPLSTPTVRGIMLCPLPHLHIRRCHHCCLNLNITRTCCTTSASDNRSTIDAVVVCFVLFMRGYIIPVQWSGEIKDPTAVVYLLLPHWYKRNNTALFAVQLAIIIIFGSVRLLM